jgi:hypothetical protein
MVAVLLVDPCPSLEEQFTGSRTTAALRNPLPHAEIHRQDSEWFDWTNEENDNRVRAENPLSMYDELVQYFENLSQEQAYHLINKTPFHWAHHCCSIVLSRNASTVQSSFFGTWKLVGKASTSVKKLEDFDFDKLERKAWSDDWKGEFFTQLWQLREELELLQYGLQMNLLILSRLVSQDNRNADWNGKGKANEGIEDMRSFDFIHEELEEWDRLVKINNYAIQFMNRTTETYVQAIGATAIQFANEQTQNSKKLTG